jgi:poly-gamma-glutamate synthesis protein (capsule biosynthesis protein)
MAALGRAGFDLLLFANNHAFDYGDAAFEDSLAEAKAAGLPLVGAGKNIAEALEGRRLSAPGMGRTGMMRFIGFGSFPTERSGFTTAEAAAGPDKAGINADEAATLAAIRAGVDEGDFVVVLAHGGSEYRFEPSREIERRYRGFIDAGAGLVLGSHPHLLQGAESYGEGLIAWSLGNFLFTGEAEPEPALESAILQLLFYRGKIRGLGLRPVFAGIKGTELSTAPARIVSDFNSRCRAEP